MCNLYSVTTNQEAIRRLFRTSRDLTGNLPPLPGIFPDYAAPIVRMDGAERVLAFARWGMPSSGKAQFEAAKKRADKLRAKGRVVDDAAFAELLRMEPDSGTTNVRNTSSKHWQRWLGPESRCLVPLTSFAEPGPDRQPVWFAFGEERPLAAFAGIWTPQWTSVRKVRTGPETIDLFAFLTTEPSEPVKAIHPKAMPVILTTEAERDAWLSAPWSEASTLQRPLPAGMLEIVARGAKKDQPLAVD